MATEGPGLLDALWVRRGNWHAARTLVYFRVGRNVVAALRSFCGELLLPFPPPIHATLHQHARAGRRVCRVCRRAWLAYVSERLAGEESGAFADSPEGPGVLP